MRLFGGQLRKLLRRPASRWALLVLGGLLVLIYVGVGASAMRATNPAEREGLEGLLVFPAAYQVLTSVLLTVGGIAAATYAGLVLGGDWAWRTFGAVVARGESRTRYVVTEFGAVALLAAVALAVLLAFGILLVSVVAVALGYGLDGVAAPETLVDLGQVTALGWYSLAIQASYGLAAAAVTRSPLAGIVLIVALFFVEQIAPVFVPADLMAYAPLTAATAIASASQSIGGAGPGDDLLQPLVVASIYFAAALLVAVVASQRAELE